MKTVLVCKKLIILFLLALVTPLSFAEPIDYFHEGYKSYQSGDYEKSITYYELYINGVSFDTENRIKAKHNLQLAYYQQCGKYFNRKDWKNSINYCYQAVLGDPSNYYNNYNLAASYYNAKDYVNAYKYYLIALDQGNSISEINDAKNGIAISQKGIDKLVLIQTKPSNDTLSYKQYYINKLNIPNAWKKVTNSNEVIVAIIDDGVFFNHPDLLGKIWIDSSAEYGASKIIDFVGDKIGINLPTGEHGTKIAGIIAAITNNEFGVAGIAKNVKIMPLRVFNFDGKASDDSIIKAINYAVNNGADIINLSLGASQFAGYSKKYDAVIKNAYDNGVVVVVAAGNGDILTKSQIGLDLSINPISPVCNNGGSTLYSIGVAAHDQIGFRTFWTNYGDCVSYFAYGSGIFSTSIPAYEDNNNYYGVGDGTSFSAPIVSGIIALGYNQFGWVSPTIVKASLDESLIKNDAGNMMIDASKYIDALSRKSSVILQQQKNRVLTKINTDGVSSVPTGSDAYILATQGIIIEQNTEKAYNLNNNVLRQEVVGMAMKLGGFTLPNDYACRKIFSDVSQSKPNDWACRAIEIGVEGGIISNTNRLFRPESRITRAEALGILFKATGISIEESSKNGVYFRDVSEQWQVNLLNTALDKGIVDAGKYFFPNKDATRAEIFNFARRLLELL